jgi:hypothetical protein
MPQSAKKSTKRRRTSVKKLSATVKEVTKKQSKRMKGGLTFTGLPQNTVGLPQATVTSTTQYTVTVAGIGAPKIK